MAGNALVDGMNDQLAAERQAIARYIQYSAVVTGPDRRELVAFFQAEMAGEIGVRTQLENLVQGETTRRDETRQMLKGEWGDREVGPLALREIARLLSSHASRAHQQRPSVRHPEAPVACGPRAGAEAL